MTARMRSTMPAICSMCGFSLSIHSRSAPFCSEVVLSNTSTVGAVAGAELVEVAGEALRPQQLAVAVDDDIAVVGVARRDLFAVEEGVILVAEVARHPADGDLLGEAGAKRIRARDDDAVLDAELQEGVAAGADLGEEDLVRHGHLAVLVAALLLVRDLVLD